MTGGESEEWQRRSEVGQEPKCEGISRDEGQDSEGIERGGNPSPPTGGLNPYALWALIQAVVVIEIVILYLLRSPVAINIGLPIASYAACLFAHDSILESAQTEPQRQERST